MAGSIPSQRIGSLSIISKTYGTLTAARSPGGTLSGARNAGSLLRGTIAAARMQTLPNIPGTLSIATKTSGTLSIATRALGTLANQRLPRNITIGTLSGLSNAGSLNRGTVPSNRTSSGTLAGARNAGSLVRGSLGINRGLSMLGSVLKGNVLAVAVNALASGPGATNVWKGVVPSGKTLRVWAIGIALSAGGTLTSNSAAASLHAGVFSLKPATFYRKIVGSPVSNSFVSGSPLVTVPTGTQFSFRVRNLGGSTKNNNSYFFGTFE